MQRLIEGLRLNSSLKIRLGRVIKIVLFLDFNSLLLIYSLIFMSTYIRQAQTNNLKRITDNRKQITDNR